MNPRDLHGNLWDRTDSPAAMLRLATIARRLSNLIKFTNCLWHVCFVVPLKCSAIAPAASKQRAQKAD